MPTFDRRHTPPVLLLALLGACLPSLPDDGDDTDTDCATAECGTDNRAPGTPTIEVRPVDPFDDDDLACLIVTGATDADGDTVMQRFDWERNGSNVGTTDNIVSADQTTEGDVWTCIVTANDGTVDGMPARASVTIGGENAAPSTPTVRIEPAEPGDDEDLDCTIETASVDPEGADVTYRYVWFVDGADAETTDATVPATRTVPGQEWTCNVTASDGSRESGLATASATVHANCGDGAVTLTASGIPFVTVCAQSFDMGCTPGQSGCQADESPVMPVTLTNAYDVSRTEITQAQYEAIMGTNPSYFSGCGDDCPVEQLSWHMAAAFANALSSEAGLDSCYSCSGSGTSTSCTIDEDPYACEGYRLLTEAEWEGAARCGEDLLYAGSNTAADVAWGANNSGSESKPVATKRSNACGLFDMTGNAGEWVGDWYSATFYVGFERIDPLGPSTGTLRVVRGGSWGDVELGALRLAARTYPDPQRIEPYWGLRIARTAR